MQQSRYTLHMTSSSAPDSETEAPAPRHRRKRRSFGVAFALAVTLVLAAGAATWFAARPRYREAISRTVGEQQAAVSVIYPAGWTVDESDYSHADADTPIAHVWLRPKSPGGLQAWLDGRLFHVRDSDWLNSAISVELQKIPSFRGLDGEIARLEPFVRQMGRHGVTYSYRKWTCPAGPVLEIHGQLPKNLQGILPPWGQFLVFPESAPGEQQYEVIVSYQTTGQLESRLHQAAIDVVSRLRIVRNTEPRH